MRVCVCLFVYRFSFVCLLIFKTRFEAHAYGSFWFRKPFRAPDNMRQLFDWSVDCNKYYEVVAEHIAAY